MPAMFKGWRRFLDGGRGGGGLLCYCEGVFACVSVAVRLSNMLVYLRDGSTQTFERAATLRSFRSNFLSHPVTVYWPTSASADPITPGAWQGSHWSATF